MDYYTADQLAKRWGISEQMVRRYCKEGRIENAIMQNGVWLIEKGQRKPKRKDYGSKPDTPERVEPEPPELLKKIMNQREEKKYAGLYDYIQINMSYSNNRLASGRLTRNQIETLYRQDKIFTNNEEIKVNDIIEARNSFLCMDLIIDEAMTPLSQEFILNLHKTLRADMVGTKRSMQQSGTYQLPDASGTRSTREGMQRIIKEMRTLLDEYEKQEGRGLEEIINLHVRFERIHPFEDCNGRIGRLIVFKECLRHGITPFIIDDKNRRSYLDGIKQWDTFREGLLGLCKEIQGRFQAFMVVSQYLEDKDKAKRRREARKKLQLAKRKVKKPS